MPIIHYVIERQDLSVKGKNQKRNRKIAFINSFYCNRNAFLGGWNSVAEIPPNQPSIFKCDDLIQKKEYKFRIRAVNKLGSSEPLMFAKPILAKDPWGNNILFSNKQHFS